MSGDDWEPERGRDRPPLVEYVVVGAAALVVAVVAWLGFSDTRDAPTVSLTTTSIVAESTSVESDSLAVAWELAERAGIECEPDDGRDLTLEVCDYRGDWVSIRVFPGGGRDAVLEWAVSMVEQWQSGVLMGDGWGIEYHLSPTPYRYLGEIQAALGEGEIVQARPPVVDEVPLVVMGGPLLDWEWVVDLEEDQDFTSVLAAESGLWAVAGDDQEPCVLWYSVDGLVWEGLDTAGLLGDGAVVSWLVEGGPGLVAVGLRPAGGSREAVAWTSPDGRDWTVSPLGYTIPEPERSFEVTGFYFEQVAAGPSGAVVAASVWESFDDDSLERNIRAALPDGLREYRIMIDLWKVSVSVGPFRVFSEWPSNLDIDQNLFDLYEQSMSDGPSDSLLFVTDDYQSWQQVDGWPGGDDDAQVGAMTATPDGFLAFAGRWGWGWESDGLYSSTDGITWQETELPPDPGAIPWFGTHDGRLLMAGGLGWDPVLWESDDGGTTWTAWAALPADAWDVRAGGLGLVAWGEHPSEWWDTWGPTVVESNGYTMTVGEEHVSISDTHGDTVLTADLSEGDYRGGVELPEFIVADHERQVFTVVDPDSGETIMTVTYREMEDAYEDAEERPEVGPGSFVAYSADGTVWSEQAIPEITGVTGWPDQVAVGDDFAVMVVAGFDDGASLWRGTAP